LLFSGGGEFCGFIFPGECKGFFEDFGFMGPVEEVFEVGELEFGGIGWHVQIIL